MHTRQKFEEGYILGCIKYKNQCDLYLMPIAYWILNYGKYDPNYNPKDWEFIFRDNVLIVNDNDIDKFMKAIEVDKINSQELTDNNINNMIFYVDFDMKLFVSLFNDIEVEEYLPDNKWMGKYDSPIKYLSPQCLSALGVSL